MTNTKATISLLTAFILSAGIFGGGFCVGKALYKSRLLNRYVTVKGLVERDVKSDLGIWEINYREIGNSLTDLDQRLQHDQTQVVAFLKQNGFVDAEMEVQPVKLEDRLANAYSQQTNTDNAQNQRYIVTGGIRIRSTHVGSIQQANQKTRALLQQGIPLTFDGSTISPNPSYYFTQLDSIRPTMLAEATRSARNVAEQFAKDSDTKLAGIQHASQGMFQIMSRDTSTMSADWNNTQIALGSIDKKIRLVTTIDYQLK